MTTPARDHALVLGAGMAGLLAARVVAEAYDRVTIVDRDELPDHPAQRRGVPQGRARTRAAGPRPAGAGGTVSRPDRRPDSARGAQPATCWATSAYSSAAAGCAAHTPA